MLWVDKKANTTLEFAADCPVEELRGQWVKVRNMVTEGELKDYLGRMIRGTGTDDTGEQEVRLAVARNTTARMALWIVDTSFTGPRGNPCPRNRKLRELWFADLSPQAAREVLALIEDHVNGALAGTDAAETADDTDEGAEA